MSLANHFEVLGNREDAVSCQAVNTGLYATGKMFNHVAWYGAGRDSSNDFVGNYHGQYLSYARKTGKGGAGSLKQGARGFHMKATKVEDHEDVEF